MEKRFSIANLVFRTLLSVNSLGFLLLIMANIFSYSEISGFAFFIIFASSIPLLGASIYFLSKDWRKNWKLAAVGIALSLLSITFVVGIIMALRNFT